MSVKKESIELLPYQNPALPIETRVNDIILRLTIEEKIRFIPTSQAAVERLGIKAYSVGGEAAHGWVSREGDPATVFPQPIGLACTWNPDLMEEIGSVIGNEARIYHKKKNTGLTLWAPTVDMERDPRWGRTEEAYGEDPYLTSKMAGSLVEGMQGKDPLYLKMATALKHFFANNNEQGRCYSSVSIDLRNMKEYYWNAFKSIVKYSKACCLMTAYNEINGTPAILNKDVKNVVKGEWGLPGFVVSDGGDFSQTVTMHHYYTNHADSIADTIKSGVDCIPDEPELIISALEEALERNLLLEEDIDNALRNIFRIRFRLGEFDPDGLNPYTKIDESALCSEKHSKLALRAAQESIVLLKNQNQFLPLNKGSLSKVAVIGPLADILYRDWYTGVLPYEVTPLQGIKNKLKEGKVLFEEGIDQIIIKSAVNGKYVHPDETGKLLADGEQYQDDYVYDFTDWGWGSYTLKSHATDKYVTTGEDLTASADQVYGWFVRELYNFQPERDGSYRIKTWDKKNMICENGEKPYLGYKKRDSLDNSGKFLINTVKNGIEQAVKAAKESEVAVVVVGNHPLINGKEEIDREDITLAPAQEELVKAVYKANPNTVLVVISSYPMAVNWADENIPAIIYLSHAGQETGNALADVLFGDYNPAGHLSMTWYRSIDQLPDIMDYDIIKGKRTYMYFDQEPLYPFGHGLTYTTFKYSNLRLDIKNLELDSSVKIDVDVKNIGFVNSDEVVQLYVHAENSRVNKPLKELKGFKKINLDPDERKVVSFVLSAEDLAFWDVTRNKFCVEQGLYKLMIGSSSYDIRLTETIEVNGEIIPARDLSKLTEAQNYDDYHGIFLDEGFEGSTCICFRDCENWVSYRDVQFDEGIDWFEALVQSESTAGTIEIRLDQPDGRLLGICSVNNGQQWSTYRTRVDKVEGQHHVFLKATGQIKLVTFCFLKSSGV